MAERTHQLRVEFGSDPTSNPNKTGALVFSTVGAHTSCGCCSEENARREAAVKQNRSVDQVVVCISLVSEYRRTSARKVHLIDIFKHCLQPQLQSLIVKSELP